jgi:ferritin
VESKTKSKYITDKMDEITKKRVQKIIDSTRDFVQDLAEEGIDVVELAQVMISMSRETLVDVYGEYVADSYISQQISYLKTQENSLTLH